MITLQSVQGHTGLTRLFYFLDIRALWRAELSARVPECQKIKVVGQTSMALNALVDSFCHNQKKCGTERVKINKTLSVLALRVIRHVLNLLL